MNVGMPVIGTLKQQQVLLALITVKALQLVEDNTKSIRSQWGVRDFKEVTIMVNKSLEHTMYLELTDLFTTTQPKLNTLKSYCSRLSTSDIDPVVKTIRSSTLYGEYVKSVWFEISHEVLKQVITSIVLSVCTASVTYSNKYYDDIYIKPKKITHYHIKAQPRT